MERLEEEERESLRAWRESRRGEEVTYSIHNWLLVIYILVCEQHCYPMQQCHLLCCKFYSIGGGTGLADPAIAGQCLLHGAWKRKQMRGP